MEALLSGFAILLTVAAILLGLGFMLRYRSAINKWLNPTYFACDDRKLRLQREIEDAQRELKWLEERELTETGE